MIYLSVITYEIIKMAKERSKHPQHKEVIPLPDDKILRLVQIETNCRRHFKVHLKLKIG